MAEQDATSGAVLIFGKDDRANEEAMRILRQGGVAFAATGGVLLSGAEPELDTNAARYRGLEAIHRYLAQCRGMRA